MFKVLLVIHVMIAIALIVVVLVQRTSSDGMGLSGGSSNNFLSGRMAANFMTRTTALLAIGFILTSLGLGIITARGHNTRSSLADRVESSAPVTAPATSPSASTPADPAKAPASTPDAQQPATTTPAVPRPE